MAVEPRDRFNLFPITMHSLPVKLPGPSRPIVASFTLRDHRELHRARQDIEDSITPFAVFKEDLFFRHIYNRPACAGFREKSHHTDLPINNPPPGRPSRSIAERQILQLQHCLCAGMPAIL
jgi:hypothetical protein